MHLASVLLCTLHAFCLYNCGLLLQIGPPVVFPWDLGLAGVLVVGAPIILCVHIEEGREKGL